MARHPAEDELTQPRVAIGAHHQEIDAVVGDVGKDDISNRSLARNSSRRRHLDAVAGEMEGNIGAWIAPVAVARDIGIDGQYGYRMRVLQERKRVVDRTRSLATPIPGD